MNRESKGPAGEGGKPLAADPESLEQRFKVALRPLIRRPVLVALAVSVLAAFVFTLIAVVVVFVLPLSSTNKDVAVGDAFAMGTFLLAAFAGVTAVVAYAQASRRPRLKTTWKFLSLRDRSEIGNKFSRDPGIRDAFQGRLPGSVRASDLVPLESVTLRARVVNDGDAAAKEVAIVFFLEGIYFSPPPTLDPRSRWSFEADDEGWKITWEGGTGALIYANIPRAPTVDLTGMWAVPHIEYTDWSGVLTVADGVKEPEIQPLKLEVEASGRGPSSAEG